MIHAIAQFLHLPPGQARAAAGFGHVGQQRRLPPRNGHHHQDVQGLAVADIGIDRQRQAGIGDLADKEADILDGDQPPVRPDVPRRSWPLRKNIAPRTLPSGSKMRPARYGHRTVKAARESVAMPGLAASGRIPPTSGILIASNMTLPMNSDAIRQQTRSGCVVNSVDPGVKLYSVSTPA
nr:hypothetical protein [Paracoccus sp. PAR01]